MILANFLPESRRATSSKSPLSAKGWVLTYSVLVNGKNVIALPTFLSSIGNLCVHLGRWDNFTDTPGSFACAIAYILHHFSKTKQSHEDQTKTKPLSYCDIFEDIWRYFSLRKPPPCLWTCLTSISLLFAASPSVKRVNEISAPRNSRGTLPSNIL